MARNKTAVDIYIDHIPSKEWGGFGLVGCWKNGRSVWRLDEDDGYDVMFVY